MNRFFYFRISFLIELLMSLSMYSLAQTKDLIQLNLESELLLVGKKMYYYEDQKGSLNIEDIVKLDEEGKFKASNTDIFIRKASQFTYWFRFTVQNNTQKEAWIEIGTNFLWYIDYYQKQEGKYTITTKTGSLLPESSKAYPSNLYLLPLDVHSQVQTVYIRVETQRPIEIPVHIGSTLALHQKKVPNDILTGAFIGLICMMCAFNLSLLISIRDTIYIWYVLYLFAAIFTTTFVNNYSIINYIFPYHIPFVHKHFFLWFGVCYGSLLIFFVDFLQLSRYSKILANFFRAIALLFLIVIPAMDLFDLAPYFMIIRAYQLLVSIMGLAFIGISLYLWAFMRVKNARFYTLGWFWAIAGIIVYFLTLNGYLEYHFYTRNVLYFGLSLEVFMFSLALGDRFNTIKTENIRIIQDQKESLEIKVRERTAQLYEINTELLQATEDIIAKNKILSDQNNSITDSINYAQRIQEAILPFPEEIAEYLKDYFILFKPRDIVSGDFYYFQDINDKLVIAAIDCTGHGVPGAFMSLLGKEILDNIVIEREILNANLILNELHKGIRKVLKQNQNDNQDGMDISLLVVNLGKRSLEFAAARNSLIYVSNNHLNIIKGDRISIGGGKKEDNERFFTNHEVKLGDQGTTFYLFSDGYQDQIGGAEKKKFMIAQMKSMFLEIHSLPMKNQKDILNLRLEQWISEGNEQQIDDVLVMGIKI